MSTRGPQIPTGVAGPSRDQGMPMYTVAAQMQAGVIGILRDQAAVVPWSLAFLAGAVRPMGVDDLFSRSARRVRLAVVKAETSTASAPSGVRHQNMAASRRPRC